MLNTVWSIWFFFLSPFGPFVLRSLFKKGAYYFISIHFFVLFFPQIVPLISTPDLPVVTSRPLLLVSNSKAEITSCLQKKANIPTMHLLEEGGGRSITPQRDLLCFFSCSWIHQFLFILNNGGSFRFQFFHHNRFTLVNVSCCFPDSPVTINVF